MFLGLLHVAAKLIFNTDRAATQYQQNERGAGRGARHNLKNKMGERCVEDEELSQQTAGPHKRVPKHLVRVGRALRKKVKAVVTPWGTNKVKVGRTTVRGRDGEEALGQARRTGQARPRMYFSCVLFLGPL